MSERAGAMELQSQEIEMSHVNSSLNTNNMKACEDESDLDLSDDSTPKRKRELNFNTYEVNLLLECVKRYEKIILNPASGKETKTLKDRAWTRVADLFNSQNLIPRTSKTLKTKFFNIRKRTPKEQRNAIFKSVTGEGGESLSDIEKDKKSGSFKNEGWDCMLHDVNDSSSADTTSDTENMKADTCDEKDCNDTDNSDDSNSKQIRTVNFTLDETKLLLNCVKDVKDIIMSPSTGNLVKYKKIKAWKQVTKKFNEQNPRPRSSANLKCRFHNMKNRAKKKIAEMNMSDMKVAPDLSDTKKGIKKEPMNYEDMDMFEEGASHDEATVNGSPERIRSSIDPLDIVLNGPIINDYNPTDEANEIVKKKLQLLNYQMETAELERNRILNLVKAEEKERQQKATEMALRLRTARLEMAAAESKLPSNHTALVFSAEETLALTYSQMETQK